MPRLGRARRRRSPAKPTLRKQILNCRSVLIPADRPRRADRTKQMRPPISLTIFFPAYNEQENLASAVEDALRVAEESPYIGDYEIIIINDGSTDATQAIAERIAAENK